MSLQGALEALALLGQVFQSDAPGVAHRLVGDAEHLHLLLGHGDLPVQGGAEGDADEQVTQYSAVCAMRLENVFPTTGAL